MAGPSIIPTSKKYGHDPIYYPIKAIEYTLAHPRDLLPIVVRVACIGCGLSIIILVLLFALALKPQAELISSNLEWWAWLIAVFLVLFEAAICAGLLTVVSQSKAQTKLFVATMRLEGQWREEMIKQSIVKDMNLVKKAFMVRMITLPIQIIPFIGGAIYSAINATFTGWDYMDRYFDAISMPSSMQRVEVFGLEKSDCSALCYSSTYDMDNDYARFGFMASFLESIPIVGWVAAPLTNAVAAALFACDIEKGGGPVCLREEEETSESSEPKSKYESIKSTAKKMANETIKSTVKTMVKK